MHRLFLLLAAAALLAQDADSGSYHFSIIGDRTGYANPNAYEQVWREVNALNPAFVVTTGDAIERRSVVPPAQQWDALKQIWRRYGNLPLYLTPGNHDIYSDETAAIFEKESGHPPRYSFSYRNAHFTVLDNSRSSDIDKANLAFLKQDLQKHRNYPLKFVLFHKSFWVPHLEKGTDFALHGVLKEYGVQYVLSGHSHRLLLAERDGITYLQIGSAGGQVPPNRAAEGYFYQHMWATVKGNQVSFTVKELSAPFGGGCLFPLSEWNAVSAKRAKAGQKDIADCAAAAF